MASKMISTNGQIQYGIDEYVVDMPADLLKLPQRSQMGSTALCLSNNEVYVKNGQGQWSLLGASSSGGGSGSGGSGVTSYNDLTDKPILNGTVLQGSVDIDTIPLSAIDELGNSL